MTPSLRLPAFALALALSAARVAPAHAQDAASAALLASQGALADDAPLNAGGRHEQTHLVVLAAGPNMARAPLW